MKEMQRACYSYKAVRECREKVYWTAQTVRVKAQHFWKCFEMEKLFDYCYDQTGCCLFQADYSPWKDYLKLVDSKGSLKKDMDRALRACHRFLLSQLDEILKMMDAGEVDAVA